MDSVRGRSFGVVLFFLLALLAASAGCADQPPSGFLANPDPPDLYDHVLQFDPDGNALDPQTQVKLDPAQSRARFNAILDRMQASLAGKQHPSVIMFVHGGLNPPDSSIYKSARRLKLIQTENADCYPLFVIWNSSIIDTYGEHLFEVRQGLNNEQTRRSAAIDFPIYFTIDFLSAIVRAPAVWLQQRQTDDESAEAANASQQGVSPLNFIADSARAFADTPARILHLNERDETGPTTQPAATQPTADVRAWELPSSSRTLAFYVKLNQLYYDDVHRPDGTPMDHPSQIAISCGTDNSHRSDWIARGASYTAGLPGKFLTSPIIDAIGSPGWRGMSRRAETIVEGPSTAEAYLYSQSDGVSDLETHLNNRGGLDTFVQDLAERCNELESQGNPRWEISLIAHSMGAMVINDLLRHQLQREVDKDGPPLHVTNVVYMAAACSIRDFLATVIPFMQSSDHQQTRFYNLSLHPTAEVVESHVIDLVPRGSLLCWIDDFLSTPETPLDRTLGRWENFVPAAGEIPRALRGRVAIKAFDLKRPSAKGDFPNPDPQTHAQFSDAPFWEKSFWQPDPPFQPEGLHAKVLEQTQRELVKKAK